MDHELQIKLLNLDVFQLPVVNVQSRTSVEKNFTDT